MGRRWLVRILSIMKKLYFLLLIVVSLNCYSSYAQHYKTRNGNIEFEASVKSFEEVKAKSNTASTILDTSTGSIASLVFINGFLFKVGLMQEHFNENYMESSIYPKATFKGKLIDFNRNNLSNTSMNYVLVGELTIRGVTKSIEIQCTVKMVDETIHLNGEFILAPEDFEIEIPKLVMNKIAKEIHVTFNHSLKP